MWSPTSVLWVLPMLLSFTADEKNAGPVGAKLVAQKTTYKLDLGGMSADEFQKAIEAIPQTGKVPPVPQVELALELTNVSDKPVAIWIGGDLTQLQLDLRGPKAVTAVATSIFTRDFRSPKVQMLEPGKSLKLPITSLQHGFRGVEKVSYWLAAGEYELTANYKTAISPAPKNSAQTGEEGFGQVVLTTRPLKLKVEGK